MKTLIAILRKISANRDKNKLMQLLDCIISGLIHLKQYFFSWWFYRNPTQEMEKEKRFFSEHSQELKAVYDFLEDDRSRFVFENILKYRVTRDWVYLKQSKSGDNQKNQYFVSELQFCDHEIIVDCGAYVGDTAKFFIKNIPGCRVIALEPDEKNIEALQKLKLEGLEIIQAGAWSEDTSLYFLEDIGGTSTGAISDSGVSKIEAKALDYLLECQLATYIKMDIEGAELEALKGAEKIIKERKPKLAICLYHKPQDFFEIPIYIKRLNPDYKLFIHHHCNSISETVLYAV
ncbi:MAG: FkbM family methyltransferase [Lachnospiraceae bacterium]|nr:FkbM family methyltransferase [Lachnospiraceae bacterium]